MSEYVWVFALLGGMFTGYCLTFHSLRAFVYHALIACLIFAFMLLRGIATHTATVSGWILRGLRYLQYGEEAEETVEQPKPRPVRPTVTKPAPVFAVKNDDGCTAYNKPTPNTIVTSENELQKWIGNNPEIKVRELNNN